MTPERPAFLAEMTQLERDEWIIDGCGGVFDDATRLAHTALIAWAAEHPNGDGWPRPRDVIRFARFYGVPEARLGGLVGLIPHRCGNRKVWIDMARTPEVGYRLGIDRFGREALLGYGMFRASWNLLARDRATVH